MACNVFKTWVKKEGENRRGREREIERKGGGECIKKLSMGLLTLTCQMARRQEAAGMRSRAVGRGGWVGGAWKRRDDTKRYYLSLCHRGTPKLDI